MENIIKDIQSPLKQMGFKKKSNMFWKIKNEFYYLIDFQKGAHGDYFFINVCIHPIGLPKLLSNKLSIVERPKEFECILRQRIEQIVSKDDYLKVKGGFFNKTDKYTSESILNTILNSVSSWFEEWGNFQKLSNKSDTEIYDKLTVVPVLKKKSILMLKTYCNLKIGNLTEANSLFNEFCRENIEGLDFSLIEDYLKSLIK